MLSSKEHSNQHACDLLICSVPSIVCQPVLAVYKDLQIMVVMTLVISPFDVKSVAQEVKGSYKLC